MTNVIVFKPRVTEMPAPMVDYRVATPDAWMEQAEQAWRETGSVPERILEAMQKYADQDKMIAEKCSGEAGVQKASDNLNRLLKKITRHPGQMRRKINNAIASGAPTAIHFSEDDFRSPELMKRFTEVLFLASALESKMFLADQKKRLLASYESTCVMIRGYRQGKMLACGTAGWTAYVHEKFPPGPRAPVR